MNSRFVRAALIGLLVLLGIIAAQPYVLRLLSGQPRIIQPRGDLASAEKTAIELFERLSPSVVQVAGVHARSGGFGPEDEGSGAQTGTGFIWDGAGHIVTNNHVVQGTDRLAVRLASGNVLAASLVGTAPNYDLAVLRVSPADLGGAAPVPVGSSTDLRVGQWAFAIGNPFGLDQSLTTGVISALKRRLPTSAGREISNVIQTDAAINPGNSGGPLLDSAGRLIGVNTAILSPSGTNAGIGFAIPVDVVNRIVPQLIRSGHVPTPGIGIVAASEAATARLGVEGVVIVRTAPGSPAERAGLRGVNPMTGELGDIIVAADGDPVRRLNDLTEKLEQKGVGQTVTISVRRGGRTADVPVQIADVSR